MNFDDSLKFIKKLIEETEQEFPALKCNIDFQQHLKSFPKNSPERNKVARNLREIRKLKKQILENMKLMADTKLVIK